MSFSFDTTAGTSQSTAKPKLEGNNIHTVKFTGASSEDIKGVKEPDKVFKVLKLKFENDNGVFEHTIFEPKPDDFKRNTREATRKDGTKFEIIQPSNVENMMLFFKHAIDAINPVIAAKIDKKEKSLGAKDWDNLRELIITILEKGKNTEVNIKLLKNKKGEAIFPNCTAISKDGVVYVNNNIIGSTTSSKINFSPYEVERIKKENNAAPTITSNMDVAAGFNVSNVTDNSDLDLANFEID